jgi:hypothetical protein
MNMNGRRCGNPRYDWGAGVLLSPALSETKKRNSPSQGRNLSECCGWLEFTLSTFAIKLHVLYDLPCANRLERRFITGA